LIIISIYSTTEVTELVPGVQNVTSWKGSSNLADVACFSTEDEQCNDNTVTHDLLT